MTLRPENRIPFSAPGLRFEKFQSNLTRVFQENIASGKFILDHQVGRFEILFAKYIGVKHCIGVNSCTDAITLTLKALEIQQGDEVITTGLTAPATIIGILNAGATPVVVDIKRPDHTIDPSKIMQSITKNTKVILPVHLHGYSCDMQAIMNIANDNDLLVIEDCAQAHGGKFDNQKLGSIGHFSVFSFYPTKNLGCLGDGGAITTNDDDVAKKLNALRNYGLDAGEIKAAGINSRLDELQASILSILLDELDVYNNQRKYWAEQYHHALNEFEEILPPVIGGSVFHQFPIRVKNRNKLRQKLFDAGLQTGIHYDTTIQDHKAFKKYCLELGEAREAANELISLPIQPEILEVHFDQIIKILKESLIEHLAD